MNKKLLSNMGKWFLAALAVAAISKSPSIVAEASDFESYDMETGEITSYDIPVSDDSSDELTLEGSAGTEGKKAMKTVKTSYVSGKSSKSAKGWFEKDGYRYYRMKNGKLCKNTKIKIGKYYYRFDKKGRMQKGQFQISSYDGTYAYYSNKTGRYLYNVVDVKISKIYKNGVVGKSIKGFANYDVYFKGVKWYDKEGKSMKKLKVKKNQTIRICYKGRLMESSPLQFQKIVKVVMQ